MDRKIVARFAVREFMGTVFVAVALMWSAGTVRWWQAWAVTLVTLLWTIATAAVILCINPDLLAERLGPRKGGKRWDTLIMGAVGILTLARLIVAGLDHRHAWSSGISTAAQIAGLIVAAAGYALAVWATASNAYFSQIVRIQTEREHQVAMTGPYRFVRHPAYVGTVLYELGLPILLGSWWALAIGAVNAVLFIVRTAMEDRTLVAELDGYDEYAEQTRYRLLPGIW